jgi:DNA polymerase-3 subunit delta'
MNTLLPWHRPLWQNIFGRLRASTLPHALLLTGPAGLGKVQFAAFLAQTLLCETGIAKAEPCGQCRSCVLFSAHNHPDLRVVRPLEAGKAIGVDQVREISNYLAYTAHYGGHKVVIVTPADGMNINAANSLLKTLEEPPAWSLILLVTDRPGRLPATILSRCQRIAFVPPSAEQGAQWLAERIDSGLDAALLLALAEGAPLRALELAESNALTERLHIMQELEGLAAGGANVSATAEQFLKIGAQQTLYWIYHWVADMIRYISCGGIHVMVDHDMHERLTTLTQRVELQGLHRYSSVVTEALRMMGGQLNPQLLMEGVLMAWQDTFRACDIARHKGFKN